MANFNGSRQKGILVPLRLMSSLRLREAAQAPAKTCAQGLVEYELWHWINNDIPGSMDERHDGSEVDAAAARITSRRRAER